MKSFLKKLGSFSVGPIVSAFLGFITVPLVTYFISTEEYGRCSMFTLAQSAAAMLIYLGLDQAFVREYHSFSDRIDRLMANVIRIPLCMVLLIDIVLLCMPSRISVILFDTPDEHLAVYLLALMLPCMVFENFGLLKIRMEERGLQYSCFVILLKALTLVFTVLLFLSYEKSFRSAIYAIAAAEIVTGLALLLVTMRHVPLLTEPVDRALVGRILRFGLPLLPASMLGWALTSMDKVMLRAMCSYSELGLYSAAYKIVNVLGVVQSCFTLYWVPLAFRWYGEKKDNRYFSAANEIVACIMCAMCFGVLLCKDLVVLILGTNFARAVYIFPFIMLYPIMYTMSETTAVGISFARKTGYNILISSISAGTNIILNYLLIPDLGGVGAAIATGVSYIVFFWGRTLVSRKKWYRFPIQKYLLYTAVILLNCGLHTFMTGWVPYVVSAGSLLLVVAVILKIAKNAYALLKEE